MQLSELERERLAAILEKYDRHPEVQRMREFIQHGDVTTYQHCKNVVLVGFWLNRRFHLGADETLSGSGSFPARFLFVRLAQKAQKFPGAAPLLLEMHGFSHPGICLRECP